MSKEPTAFALGLRDRSGRQEYLRAGVLFGGNMMRTDHPLFAFVWPTVDELERWVDDLPEHCKDQLADRELLVVPLRMAVGVPTQTLTLRTVEPEPKPQTKTDGKPARETPKEPSKRTLNKSMILFGDQQ